MASANHFSYHSWTPRPSDGTQMSWRLTYITDVTHSSFGFNSNFILAINWNDNKMLRHHKWKSGLRMPACRQWRVIRELWQNDNDCQPTHVKLTDSHRKYWRDEKKIYQKFHFSDFAVWRLTAPCCRQHVKHISSPSSRLQQTGGNCTNWIFHYSVHSVSIL